MPTSGRSKQENCHPGDFKGTRKRTMLLGSMSRKMGCRPSKTGSRLALRSCWMDWNCNENLLTFVWGAKFPAKGFSHVSRVMFVNQSVKLDSRVCDSVLCYSTLCTLRSHTQSQTASRLHFGVMPVMMMMMPAFRVISLT